MEVNEKNIKEIGFSSFTRHGKKFFVLKIDRKISHFPNEWPLVVFDTDKNETYGTTVRKNPFPCEEIIFDEISEVKNKRQSLRNEFKK